MAERNFMNTNEVYPILDMINRKINQGKGVSHHYESPLFDDGSGSFDTSQWQVESFEVTRDVDNAIDPEVIKTVTIIYRNGAIDTITLIRGLNPPVDTSVDDYEYINNLMIVEVHIRTTFDEREQGVIAKIFKEGGYGSFQKVELVYDDSDWHGHEDEREPIEYENPNDFYDGGGSDSGYDTDVDTAEDFADSGYTPGDELEMPDSGWADGFNPSRPVDVDVDEEIV